MLCCSSPVLFARETIRKIKTFNGSEEQMKQYAIKEHHLYNKTFSKGQRAVGKMMAVYVLRDYAAKRIMQANPQKEYLNRVGLSVGKKIGTAVYRNRAKRLLREGYRAVQERGVAKGYLIVLAAREEIAGKKAQDVQREMLYLFRRLSLLPDQKK